MRSFIIAAGVTLALAGSSLAQNQNAGQTTASGTSSVSIQQKVKRNLAEAGFSDIKVMPESFLVRAKDKSGNPVMMIINPDSVTAVTAMNGGNGNSGSSAAAAQQVQLTSQQKQKIQQVVASQPPERAPPGFQAGVGQKVPGSLSLKPFPSGASSQLPQSLKDDQFAKLENNDIVIVDPDSREVVAVVNGNTAE